MCITVEWPARVAPLVPIPAVLVRERQVGRSTSLVYRVNSGKSGYTGKTCLKKHKTKHGNKTVDAFQWVDSSLCCADVRTGSGAQSSEREDGTFICSLHSRVLWHRGFSGPL